MAEWEDPHASGPGLLSNFVFRCTPPLLHACVCVHTHTPQPTRLPVHPLYPLATAIRTVTLLVSSVLTNSENLTKVH